MDASKPAVSEPVVSFVELHVVGLRTEDYGPKASGLADFRAQLVDRIRKTCCCSMISEP